MAFRKSEMICPSGKIAASAGLRKLTGKATIGYRPVHDYPMSNDIGYVEPKASVYWVAQQACRPPTRDNMSNAVCLAQPATALATSASSCTDYTQRSSLSFSGIAATSHAERRRRDGIWGRHRLKIG
jgi:hypothetical protein